MTYRVFSSSCTEVSGGTVRVKNYLFASGLATVYIQALPLTQKASESTHATFGTASLRQSQSSVPPLAGIRGKLH